MEEKGVNGEPPGDSPRKHPEGEKRPQLGAWLRGALRDLIDNFFLP